MFNPQIPYNEAIHITLLYKLETKDFIDYKKQITDTINKKFPNKIFLIFIKKPFYF